MLMIRLNLREGAKAATGTAEIGYVNGLIYFSSGLIFGSNRKENGEWLNGVFPLVVNQNLEDEEPYYDLN